MCKVTVWRMRERYAQTVLTFRIIYIYPSLCIQIGIAWKEATKVQTEPSVIYVCIHVHCPVIYDGYV